MNESKLPPHIMAFPHVPPSSPPRVTLRLPSPLPPASVTPLKTPKKDKKTQKRKTTTQGFENGNTDPIDMEVAARPKIYVHKACVSCKLSHVACDVGRPCQVIIFFSSNLFFFLFLFFFFLGLM